MDASNGSIVCPRCGSSVSAEDRFCPRCGEKLAVQGTESPVVAPAPALSTPTTPPGSSSEPTAAPPAPPGEGQPVTPATTAPSTTGRTPATSRRQTRERNTTIVWVLLALIALLLIAWAVLAGFPFGEGEDELRRRPQSSDVVVESPAAEPSRDVIIEEIAPQAGEEVPIDQVPESAMVRPATPQQQTSPRSAPAPAGGFSSSSPPEGNISESEAVARVTSWVNRNDRYGVDPNCVRARSEGYSNRGFTIVLVADGCSGRTGQLGRWRVDTLTGRVYEQKPDGRFLDP